MDIDHVPVHQVSLVDLPSDRMTATVAHFIKSFDKNPSFVVRVPGRVNLIGEHIDYCGYAVFPMAVEKDIVLAVDTNSEAKINLTNLQKDLYDNFQCGVAGYEICHPPKWKDYFLCGHKGVLDQQAERKDAVNSPITSVNSSMIGLDVAVLGSLPPSSGLSSSSALVCGSAVASHYANHKLPMNKTEMANLCADSERFIGTQGGGMDQAIAFLAQEGSAKLIEFVPRLIAHNVQLPQGANFFISHSGVSCNKGATDHFNIRVLETKTAAVVLTQKLSRITGDKSLMSLKNFTLGAVQCASGNTIEQMVAIVAEHLKETPYSKEDLFEVLAAENESELIKALAPNNPDSWSRFKRALESNQSNGFKLHDRALHVYQEANRVFQFKSVCDSPSLSNADKLNQLGQLMDKSHASCRDLYECSCLELENLVDAAKASGARGARLTGAGWGGCVVSLVEEKDCQEFQRKMEQYSEITTKSFTFNSKPGGGVAIYTFN